MRVLGIETSCDETAVAIVDTDRKIHANLVRSQIEIHRETGGVVPEVAARAHMEVLPALVDLALKDADMSWDDIDGIAATSGPGLIGGVMTGMMCAKGLAFSLEKPFIGVNHLEGHALTPCLSDDVPFPFLLLLVSGGHTQILAVEGVGKYTLYGTTRDDAAGECFDKAGKAMGLSYPGGPEIEKLARLYYDETQDSGGPYQEKVKQALAQYPLPKPLCGGRANQFSSNDGRESDFSFSGLKTAVLRHIEAIPEEERSKETFAPLAFALQHMIFEIMLDRLERAIERFKRDYKDIFERNAQPYCVIAGGVAANQYIGSRLKEEMTNRGLRFAAPPMGLCTDNAAMIAWAGVERLKAGLISPLSLKARPRWPLEELQNIE